MQQHGVQGIFAGAANEIFRDVDVQKPIPIIIHHRDRLPAVRLDRYGGIRSPRHGHFGEMAGAIVEQEKITQP